MRAEKRFWFLFARQRKKNPFPSKMEGLGVVEYRIKICNGKPPPWKGGGMKNCLGNH
jgi:hypothetical protein